jgi:mannosyltransferase OCH1-like enzyme
MIPKVIYICDKDLTFINNYSKNWEVLNPDYEIKLYDDKMCEDFLREEFSELHYEIFKFIKDGPIKADFWRICVLYKYGGVYVDADIELLIPIFQFIEKDIDFITCSSSRFYALFNPNFIMSYAGNDILKNCINVYIEKYNTKEIYSYINWSIVTIMKWNNVLDIKNIDKKYGIYNSGKYKIQIIQEISFRDSYQDHMIYKDVIIFNNRYKTYNEKEHKFNE